MTTTFPAGREREDTAMESKGFYLERLSGNMPQCLGWCGRPTFDFRGAKLFATWAEASLAASAYQNSHNSVMDHDPSPWRVEER